MEHLWNNKQSKYNSVLFATKKQINFAVSTVKCSMSEFHDICTYIWSGSLLICQAVMSDEKVFHILVST